MRKYSKNSNIEKYYNLNQLLSILLYLNTVLFSSGSQRRRSLSLPVLTLIFPALLPCLVRDSLCTALQTKIPLQWPWQGCCWNLPRECNAVRRSCVPPPPYRHYRHYRHCPPPPPPTIRLCSLRSAGLVKRVWPAPDQWLRDQMAACWAGFTSPVAMLCMCFCVAEVFFLFSHCTPQGA